MLRAHLIPLAVLTATPAFAQSIYRWVDADGVTHYTDNSASVPQGVAVFATDGEPISHMGKPGPVPTSAPKKAAVAVVAPAPAADAVPSTDDGPNEVYWRAQFRAAREKIRGLEDEIAADSKRTDDVNVGYNCAPQIAAYGGYAPAPTATVTITPQGGSATFGTGQYPQTYFFNQCIPRLNPEYDRTQRRLEKNKRALIRAQDDLHELERRAAFDAVPLEWRR